MSLRDLLSAEEWLVEEDGLDPSRLNYRESLFAVGNGYLGTRGSLEEGTRGEVRGTYLAGVYDHHDSTVIDLVNVPSWLPLSLWVDGEQLDVQRCTVLEHRHILDLRQGLLYRLTRFEDSAGNRTRYESLRYASFDEPHLGVIEAAITPENHAARLAIEAGVDGRTYNLDRLPAYEEEPTFHPEVKWEKWAKSKHFDVTAATVDEAVAYLEARTLDRGHRLGFAASLEIDIATASHERRVEYQRIASRVDWQAEEGVTYRVRKLVAMHTSRDADADDGTERLAGRCRETLASAGARSARALREAHVAVWDAKWRDADVAIDGAPLAQKAVRYAVYQLLIAVSGEDDTVNIGANALTGERYKGHVFWDTEIYLLPFYIFTRPATARSLILYRYHTLEGARQNARDNGFEGAQYAWESADTGLEETPKRTADGVHRLWMSDEEFHITADVVFGLMSYVEASGDHDLLACEGAEILVQTSRFWISRLEHDAANDRFELSRVMGPDEFHEHVDNNAFTNQMVRWHLRRAAETMDWLRAEREADFENLVNRFGIDADEVDVWRSTAERVHVPQQADTGLIEQFDGYFDLKDVPIETRDENDMPVYPEGYHHFNTAETTLIKQPDAVMLFYMLPDRFDADVKRANYDYYEARTMHKSSLSPAIHSIMGIEVGDRTKAEQYFMRSALVDLNDNQGNTELGIHIASAGGTWQCAVCGFGGFRVIGGTMTFKPWLPPDWNAIGFRLQWHGVWLAVTVRERAVRFALEADPERTERFELYGEPHEIRGGETLELPYRSGD